jgi:RsiW-degrading membrane proteinase PrsW (M82 family)
MEAGLTGLLLSLLFGFVPMFIFAWLVYLLDRYEKEPGRLLGGVFIWGAVVAAGSAYLINTMLGMEIYLFTGSATASNLTTSSIVAPIVEESLKGLAVLIVFWIFHQEFDSLMDGILYAAIVALGFAATENAFYIYTQGFQADGLPGILFMAFVRVVMVGWQHPFYTAFTGIGLAIARLNRGNLIKIFAPILGWSLAVFTHSVHNTLATLLSGEPGIIFGTALDWVGWLSMFAFALWALSREQGWIRSQLREELELGLITTTQYRMACSTWSQTGARFNAIRLGRYPQTRRFFQACAELAFKKQQRMTMGEEGHNSQIIAGLRNEIARLSPLV